jgi:predicted ATPase
MNILTWLRKPGHEPYGAALRAIDVDGLEEPKKKAVDLRAPSVTVLGQRQVLLSAIALPRGRAVAPKRRPDAERLRRFAVAPEQRRPTPLVGRETELRRLLNAWRLAAAGRGQVVLLSGDAGVGKSRIVRELCELRAGHPHTALRHRCLPEHAFIPLHPVIGPPQEVAGLAGAELARIEHLARQQMVVAVYEDLQWADSSMLEFLDRLVDRVPSLPVLALMTFRPVFEASWDGRARTVPLALAPLERGPCEAMISCLAGSRTLAEPILEQIIARSAGVPLLIEELTKSALAVIDGIEQDEGADATPAVMIPSTLAEGLIARLGPASDFMAVAQIGAVIGCEFSCELLAAVIDWTEDRLQSALDQVIASELVSRCGPARDATYVFKHALIRDALYHNAPEPLRRNLHGAIARILEARWPAVAASTPEILAQHYAAAGLVEMAVAYWLRAGRRASDRRAQVEAIAMFGRGLELLDRLPAAAWEPATQREELLAALAQALIVAKGLAAPEVARACDVARTLCQRAAASPRLFPAMRSLWEYYNTRGDFEAACELAGQCQKLAASAQEPSLVTEADFCLGVSSLFVGRLSEARERLNRSVVRFEPHSRRDLAASEVRDPRIIALVHLAQALWLSGYPDQAVRVSQEALEKARAAGHPFTLTYALLGASWVSQFRREFDATRALAADAIACATEESLPAFLAMARILRDWASVDPADAERTAATAAIRTALDDYRATGVEIARPYLLGLLAEVHGALYETEPALDALDEAAKVACATGEHWYEPEILRREGELLLRQSVTNRRVASARFCQAIAVAQRQGGKSLELRAAVSLARLWADLGRRTQARDLLAPIYGWFKEGFDIADLRDARALLDEL